jgi:deoxyribonuclease V
MRINQLHEWNLSLEEAKAVQKNLRAWITLEDQFSSIKNIARIKVKSLKNEPVVKASVRLLGYPDLKPIETQSAAVKTSFPAVNGYHSFRHMPAVIEALKSLKKAPDLILCDGRGIISEQSFGLASHIGLFTHKPCIGINKVSKDISLVHSLENVRGAWIPIPSGNTVVSGLLRVSEDSEAIQVSPGYGISINTTIKYVLECFPKEIQKRSFESIAIDINAAKKKAAN